VEEQAAVQGGRVEQPQAGGRQVPVERLEAGVTEDQREDQEAQPSKDRNRFAVSSLTIISQR